MTTLNLDAIQTRFTSIKTMDLTEIDIQFLLIEPVLQLAGWNIYDPRYIKRASRSKSQPGFDIEAYSYRDETKIVRLAIECKSVSSPEFNYKKLSSRKGIGKLTQKQHKDLSIYWANDNQDGVGQLRAYCLRYPQFSEEDSLAILTNGEEWLIFNNENMLKEDTLDKKITNEAIKAYCKITDANFETEIIKKIQEDSA